MESLPLLVWLETAQLGADAVLRVHGWAAGAERVERVEIWVRGAKIGEADYGEPRPDVAAQRPDLANGASCGFRFAGTLDKALRNAQEVVVIARAESGAASTGTLLIGRGAVAEEPVEDGLRFHCDSFTLLDNGDVEIAGWAAHADEVVGIEVRLDGVDLGAARTGGDRPDVGRAQADIPSARKSGFTFRKSLDALRAGEHKAELSIALRNGETLSRTLTAATQIAAERGSKVEHEDIRLCVDKPAVVGGAFDQPVRRLLTIDGWAVGRYGLAAVEAYLDGVLIGAASRGVRRHDIAADYPDWPESLTSGYAFVLPRKLFFKDRHVLRIAARDRRGEVAEVEVRVAVEPEGAEDAGHALRRFVPQAEIDLKQALIAASGPQPAFVVLLAPGAEDGLARTLESLRAQAYRAFQVGFLTGAGVDEDIGAPVVALDAQAGVDLAAAVGGLWDSRAARRLFVVRLREGDELGADALLEFALEIATRPEEDFLYADDRRYDPVRRTQAPWLKPEWSPDLLLSTNYIGRAWIASLDLVHRAGLSVADARDGSDYDLALRLAESAREIGRAPLVLAAADVGEAAESEGRAIRAAMARRGLAGGLREVAPGVYRLRRRVRTKGLVSIVIPTIGAGGLIEACLKSLRERTAYHCFEIVCVDNIADEDSPWKEWLKRNADCVVEYPGPFNWSKLNNLGAEAALGEYLLFLNDDIEAIEPRWLHALMEHAQREEVGVVGPKLLYSDKRVQHAGMFLLDRNARHAFRFAEDDEPGDFGLAAAQRNVASVTGACMLMRKAAFDEVGGFDENHAVVNNDVDMCLRMWRAGLRVVYTPHAKLIHHEMASRAELKDEFDQSVFDAQWRPTFALGDPFFHPRLSREDNDYAPEPEPARMLTAGRPLLARESVRRILVMKLDHVGDFITGLPAIQRLKHRFPDAEIHLLAPTASVALARYEPVIANVIEFNFFQAVSQQGRRAIDEREWKALEARLKPYRFDIAIDLRKHADTRDALKHSGARMTAGFDHRGQYAWLDVALEWDGDLPFFDKHAQVADDYVALVEAVSLACERGRQFLQLAAAPDLAKLPGLADLRPGLFDRPLVGVHPAAGSVLRQWPPEHFASLIDLIADSYDVNIVLIGAPNEAAIVDNVFAETRAQDRIWSLLGRTQVAELPVLLAGLRLFVGNNSGPHHVAAALGVPTVGVHSGVVSAREWGPLGPMAVAVQRQMSCGPCYLDKPSRCARGIACLQGLRPADVFRACEQMLGPGLRRG